MVASRSQLLQFASFLIMIFGEVDYTVLKRRFFLLVAASFSLVKSRFVIKSVYVSHQMP